VRTTGPGERVAQYVLTATLGEGATGVVYRARAHDGADVALKVLRPERSPDDEARARFARELRLVTGLDLPHVVPILAVGEHEGVQFLVMPLYERGSLAARLRERGTLGVAETAALAAQLGRGLDALHERGILHRDVKPSNVLLDGDDALLADFGLARAADSTRVTEDGQLLGTPHYLAPELIEGRDATRASDVYALGCVLYECLTGAPPFAGRAAAEIGFAHLVETPVDPAERRQGVPAEAGAAVLSALEKDPEARPTSSTALARMLHVASRSALP
jgi:eukaryotic-like serine/threonine-protein kinase